MRDHTMQHDTPRGHRHHPDHHDHDGRQGDGGRHPHHGRAHHPPEGGPFGHGGGRPHHGGHGGGGSFGGPRERARRGEARYVLLDALRDGPKHGYEIIKSLEERSGGQYAPSPGTVYPTLQYLEDAGQVRSDQDTERRVYHLTDAGRAELEARAEDLNAFWTRFGASASAAASGPELGFLREELDDLSRAVWGGLRSVPNAADPATTLRQVRQALERCRGEVRDIIAQSAATAPE